VFQFALAGSEAVGDFAQGIGFSQLTEEHADELVPAGEAPGVAFGVSSFDELLEFMSWKEL